MLLFLLFFQTDCNFCNKYDAVCPEKETNMQTFDKHNHSSCEREGIWYKCELLECYYNKLFIYYFLSDSCRLIHSSPVRSIMATKTTSSQPANLNYSTCSLPHSPKHQPYNRRHQPDTTSDTAKHNLNQNHNQPPYQPSSPLLDRNAAAASVNNRTINVYFPVNNRLQQTQLVHLHQSQMIAMHPTLPPPPAGFAGGHTVLMQQQQQMPGNYHQAVQIPVNNGTEYRLVQQQQSSAASPQHTATVHGEPDFTLQKYLHLWHLFEYYFTLFIMNTAKNSLPYNRSMLLKYRKC